MSDTIIAAIISGVVAIVAALIAASASKANPNSPPGIRKISRRVLLLLIGLLIFIALLVLFTIGPGKLIISKLSSPYVPVKTLSWFDFENSQDVTDVKPFFAVPEAKKPELLISSEEVYLGRKSLRLKLNIGVYTPENQTEYGGIGITTNGYPDLGLSTTYGGIAWVYLPKSEQVISGKLFAHMFGYIYGANNESLAIYGNDVQLMPGKWTPVMWGASPQVQSKQGYSFASIDKKTHEIYLTIWSAQPYIGSIYVDEILFYEIKE